MDECNDDDLEDLDDDEPETPDTPESKLKHAMDKMFELAGDAFAFYRDELPQILPSPFGQDDNLGVEIQISVGEAKFYALGAAHNLQSLYVQFLERNVKNLKVDVDNLQKENEKLQTALSAASQKQASG